MSLTQCDSTDIVRIPDVEAQFPGGTAKMVKFIQENIEYPPIERCSLGQPTRLYVKFIVCTDGTITDVSCIRCSNMDFDVVGTELIEKMPNWIPAQVDGKPVSSYVRLPIHIELN